MKERVWLNVWLRSTNRGQCGDPNILVSCGSCILVRFTESQHSFFLPPSSHPMGGLLAFGTGGNLIRAPFQTTPSSGSSENLRLPDKLGRGMQMILEDDSPERFQDTP